MNFLRAGIAGFQHLFQHKSLRLFALNSALISAVTFFIFWLYQPLAGKAGIQLHYYGWIGAGFNLFGVFLLHRIKWLEKIFGIQKLIFISALLPAVLFIALAFFQQVILVLVAIFLIAGLKLLRKPLLADFMNQHIESENRATVLSGISMIERAGTMVLYLIVGFLADLSLTHALAFLGVITLVLTFLTKIGKKHFYE